MSKTSPNGQAPKYKKLSPVQNGKLYTWLAARKAEALTTTAEKMAADASRDLGFTVTHSQLGTMRSDMGLTVAVGRGPGKPKPLDPRIIVLAETIQHIIKVLGHAPDEAVQAIIDGNK